MKRLLLTLLLIAIASTAHAQSTSQTWTFNASGGNNEAASPFDNRWGTPTFNSIGCPWANQLDPDGTGPDGARQGVYSIFPGSPGVQPGELRFIVPGPNENGTTMLVTVRVVYACGQPRIQVGGVGASSTTFAFPGDGWVQITETFSPGICGDQIVSLTPPVLGGNSCVDSVTIETTCLGSTASPRTTWGTLKLLYRS